MTRVVVALFIVFASAACTHQRAHPAEPAPTTTSVPSNTTTTTEPSPHFIDVPVTLTPIDASPTCGQAVRTGTLDGLLSAFRAARIHGSGAEGCMTTQALHRYCTDAKPCTREQFEGSPGPICLYSCRGYKVSAVDLYPTRADDGTTYVQVSLATQQMPGAAQQVDAFSLNESLTIGSGLPVGATVRRPLVIVEATTSA